MKMMISVMMMTMITLIMVAYTDSFLTAWVLWTGPNAQVTPVVAAIRRNSGHGSWKQKT